MAKHIFKILRFEHRKIYKEYLAIFSTLWIKGLTHKIVVMLLSYRNQSRGLYCKPIE